MTGAAAQTVPPAVGPEDRQAPPRADLASEAFLRAIPRDFARSHLILSQGRRGAVEHLAVAETTSPAAIFNVGVELGIAIETRVVDGEAIARAIDEAYERFGAADQTPSSDRDIETVIPDAGDIDRLLRAADQDLLSTQGKGPIVKLVDALLFEAASRGASDLHVEPMADATLIRYRIDGVLHCVRTLPTRIAPALVSRVKVMGRMDIAERRVPQDGRATVTVGKRPIDLRISTLPTSYGERAVLRLLDATRDARLQQLSTLGMAAEAERAYLDRAGRASGILLLTGPTGSGKTTTLYATLRWISRRDGGQRNVMTIEDPIEYELSGTGVTISQAQVNTRKGVTFATGLRHILRQDPDVIMVGEIRDEETARIAIQSSLTGHLVFSTLHTNDAASAVTRLMDLGVEPYLIGASLSAVVAQRLARRFHDECGGAGCEACMGSGFRGRIGLFELLLVDACLRELISAGASATALRAAARAAGMRTLAEEGERLVREGMTTEAEVLRVVQGAGGAGE